MIFIATVASTNGSRPSAKLVRGVQARRALYDDKCFFAEGESGVDHLKRIPGVTMFYPIGEWFFTNQFQKSAVIGFFFLPKQLAQMLEVLELLLGCHIGRRKYDGRKQIIFIA